MEISSRGHNGPYPNHDTQTDHTRKTTPTELTETPTPQTPTNHPQEIVSCLLEHSNRPNGGVVRQAPFNILIGATSDTGSMLVKIHVPYQPSRKSQLPLALIWLKDDPRMGWESDSEVQILVRSQKRMSFVQIETGFLCEITRCGHFSSGHLFVCHCDLQLGFWSLKVQVNV